MEQAKNATARQNQQRKAAGLPELVKDTLPSSKAQKMMKLDEQLLYGFGISISKGHPKTVQYMIPIYSKSELRTALAKRIGKMSDYANKYKEVTPLNEIQNRCLCFIHEFHHVTM